MASLKPKHFVFLSLVVLLGPARRVSSHLGAPPTAIVALHPVGAYADLALRGSATFSDPDGDLEGVSTYRWLVNGSPEAAGEVPQSMLLPLDGGLLSTDGQAPGASQGLAFVAGRFGQAVQASMAANSLLAYPAAGNVDPHEGSLEMWINLTYDLADPAYDDDPRLFVYDTDSAGLLHIKAQADRIIIGSCNGSNCYDAWPDPPGWQAGEWHHLVATWSASANRLALYYDCVLVAEDGFSALAGSADHFHLGSGHSGRAVMDATFDDVRLSRRALSVDEVVVSCSRNGPAPNDELVLLPGQVSVGDLVTFELTPCDDTGACGASSSASATVAAPPLGVLEPTPGLLPSSTVSVTLSLTTTAPANCRWSEQPHTPYDSTPHDFQQGQNTTQHIAIVSGLRDLDERWFYVHCQDLSTGRDPDDYERQTHLRVLGPWDGGYPRIANLWSNYDPELGVGFFAGYDLFIPYSWGRGANQAAAIRAVNPNAKVLAYQYVTKGRPESHPLIAEWWNSNPGDPGYNCLLRDSSGDILLYSGHPMCNMTVPYCRTLLAQQNVDDFLSLRPDQGADLAYDGIYWDLLHGHISWLGDDIDSDLDGQPDDPEALDAAHQAGVEEFLAHVRAHLPHAILVGNEAPPDYATWINGRFFEWHLAAVLNGSDWLTWDAVVADYRDWIACGHTPRATFIANAPEAIYAQKYSSQCACQAPPAMEQEAVASHRRMRYGLTSALMGDGLFYYDLRGMYDRLWWYDEFGAPGGHVPHLPTLPPRGYLGQPAGAPTLLVDTLDTPDQVINGDFEGGLSSWDFWVNTDAGAAASVDVDPNGGVSGSAAAHIVVTGATGPSDVQLSQHDQTTVAGQSYILSFWARSDVTRTIYAKIAMETPPGTNYGFNVQALVTPQWHHFHLWDDASVTATDGELSFKLGEETGELWLDDVQLQAGELGVWARPFDHGLAVVNTTREVQIAPLPDVYCKLHGSQAPLFQTRVDDDEAQVSAGWSERAANDDQFGATVQVAPAGTVVTVTFTPTLAYSGTYEVLAWVAPTATQSSAVSVTVRHAQGEAVVLLDQTAGEVGWHSLGAYDLDAGEREGAVLAATGDGTVVADAFKWVSLARYNDGGQVNQIILQPQDGIVLLSECYQPDWRVYLPLVEMQRRAESKL